MNWSDITLQQYLDFKKLNLDTSTPTAQFQASMKVVAFFTNKSALEITDMTMTDFQQHLNDLAFLGEPKNFEAFMEAYFDPSFEGLIIDGEAYLTPKSLPQLMSDKLQPLKGQKVGDYIDGMQFKKIIHDMGMDELEAIPYIAALFWRKYEEESTKSPDFEREAWLEARAKVMRQMSMDYAWQVYFFLIRHLRISAKVFLTCLAVLASVETLSQK